MKKVLTLCLALFLSLVTAVRASAADYEFSTAGKTGYYDSTNYEAAPIRSIMTARRSSTGLPKTSWSRP